ncbi:MAG: adenylyltransferase/cytidyltransferase family protein [Clostridia bacterium]|nr:adenylyltransferase/cytidyltransferase family protein [Clostridia bacterium]
MKQKIGLTIGKFAPLHKGHEFLIETGLKEMDRFVVVVYETDKIDVSIERRAGWIRKLFPEVEIRYAINPPSQYGLDEESVKVQMEYLVPLISDLGVTHFYSSEEYGRCVADYLGIIDRRVDSKRVKVPVSGSLIRENKKKYSSLISDVVLRDL